MIRVLETVRAVAPFGVRFWDPVLDEQIRNGLSMKAWSETGAGRRVQAFRTASDVYALHGLPGLQAVEYPPAGGELAADSASSPPPTRGFVVQVDDLEGRYLSAAFEVELPLGGSGLFPSPPLSSPPGSPAAGFLLFSSPVRRAPAWLAVVRGELEDANTNTPARNAMLRVELGPESSYGLADADGRFAVFLRYPPPEEFLGGSPAGTGPRSLGDSTWPVRIEVFYSPTTQTGLEGTELPSYLSVLSQDASDIYTVPPSSGGVAEPDWSGELAYGEQLIVRSQGSSRLLISPGDSSP